MDPEISGIELLDIAQQALSTEIIQRLEGDPRNVALMIGRAMRMVAREFAQLQRRFAAQAALLEFVDDTDHSNKMQALCWNIRNGRHDAHSQLHAALWADAAIRTSISKPSLLARTERRLAGLSENASSSDRG